MPIDLTPWDARELQRIRRKIDTLSGPGVTNTPERITVAQQPQRAAASVSERALRLLVKVVYNDYLSCVTWDGTNEGADPILVAKPYELRHILANYPQLSAFTTVDVGEATVTYDATDYTWKVTPDYVVDAEIYAKRVSGTGVMPSTVELTLEDDNDAGRAWGIEE